MDNRGRATPDSVDAHSRVRLIMEKKGRKLSNRDEKISR